MNRLRQAFDFLAWFWLLATTPPDSPETPDPVMNRKLQKFLEVTWLKWLWTMKFELLSFALLIALFFRLPGWLSAADDTSAPLDPGVLSMPAVGLVAVMAGVLLFWLLIRGAVPYIDKWFDGDLKNEYSPTHRINFEEDWRTAPGWVRLLIFAFLFGVVVLGVCLVTLAAF
jgi:hypothetical protein